jgi:hypothetical protein
MAAPSKTTSPFSSGTAQLLPAALLSRHFYAGSPAMANDQHSRGMSDYAPLYALLILFGMLGTIVFLVWGVCHCLF